MTTPGRLARLRQPPRYWRMRHERIYYVYILASGANGTLYIGMTNNLSRRVFEHRQGLVEGFTKRYGVKRLVHFEEYPIGQMQFIAKSE